MKITMLGCGSSAGVPLIGCDCAVCHSANPKNKRTRVSLYIEINNLKLLIDSSPDLRQQCLREGIRRIDAVLYTHEHADHANGLDDLRLFNYIVNSDIPIYGTQATISDLQVRFPYAFNQNPKAFGYRPCLTPHIIPDGNTVHFKIQGIDIIGFEQIHGKRTTNGYRIGNFG